MRRRLVIDDVRVFKPVEGMETVHCLKAEEGLEQLYDNGPWDQVWLDHDLGWDHISGTYLVEMILWMKDDGIEPEVDQWFVHSANMVSGDMMWRRLIQAGYPVMRVSAESMDMLDWDATDQRSDAMREHATEEFFNVFGRPKSDAGTLVTG